MIHLAVFQFVIGFFLAAALIYLTRRIVTKIFTETELTCDAISPDSALTCRREPGHPGWCQHEKRSWYEDVWNMDHWCDTLSWWTADVENNGDPTERAPKAEEAPNPSDLSFDWDELYDFDDSRLFSTSRNGTTEVLGRAVSFRLR